LTAVQACTPQAERPQVETDPVETPQAADSEAPYHLFLLAGQSNMAGRGVVDDASGMPHPRVWMLSQAGEWVPATDPVHFDKPIAGVGPGKAFGEVMAERHPGIRIGLIPAAVGGSPISSWKPGARDAATGTHPYDDALQRARRAMADGELKAVLWHQGESDSNEARAPSYKENLSTFIDQIRSDLESPDLPVLIGQLGRFEEKPWDEWRAAVNQAHEAIAREVPHTAYVSSEGLSHKGDTLHFSTGAERQFGERYASAYEKLEP
jgi:hypothetical protein